MVTEEANYSQLRSLSLPKGMMKDGISVLFYGTDKYCMRSCSYFKRLFGWASFYLFVIVAFAVVYYFTPDKWGGNEPMDGIIDSFYFSVVTITTLGFGDIYPVSGSPIRILVSAEAILGVLIIGFFLNDVAQKQAIRIDSQNKQAAEEKKAADALEGLRTFRQMLQPVLERYLRGVFMMITPMKEKFNMPQDIFHYDFNFQFKDLGNLYEQTILMSSDHYVPSVNAHFRNQEIAFNELRFFVTNADLTYWPDLKKLVYDFISLHQQFQFQEIIINNGLRKMGDGSKMSDYIAKMIAGVDKAPKFESGNMFSPYVALYHYTKGNVAIVQSIYKLMESVIDENAQEA